MTTEFNLHSLSSLFISYDKLSADWRTYRKDPERYIHRFISIKKRSFQFLGVTASYQVRNYQSGLLLCSSQYIGAAPLLSPMTGEPTYDLNVTPMFGENLGQVITLLGERIDIEYAPMKLLRPLTFRVPVYFSCIEFMKAFEKAIGCKWTKFSTKLNFENRPTSSTDWCLYAKNSFMPDRHFSYANIKSFHSPIHTEWMELTSLLRTVINTYISSNPPIMVRCRYESLISRLKEYIRTNPSQQIMAPPTVVSSDPPVIKNLKAEAYRFISQKSDFAKSWRIEVAALFERFVQHTFEKAARLGGWKWHFNEHFVIKNPSGVRWVLRYIEPDIVLSRDDKQWVIDAKYKSHIYNRSSKDNDSIKSSFREDYHQILAYTSFAPSTSSRKQSMIVYPYSTLWINNLTAESPITGVVCETKLIGLPFTTDSLEDTVINISKILNED